MPNCRAIPEEYWHRAFKALALFFRHHGCVDAEDLAQQTLLTVCRRDDLQFEKAEDFLKIVWGFARRILMEARRRGKRSPIALDPDVELEAPTGDPNSAAAIENRTFLEEVLRLAASKLRQGELDALQRAMAGENSGPVDPKEMNRRRVMLHRARQKLLRLIRDVMPYGQRS